MVKTNNNQLAFLLDNPYIDTVEHLFDEQELQQITLNEQKFYINYAESYWLEKYQVMESAAKALHIPSITSSWSDSPSSPTGMNESKTEKAALRKVTAEEWINIFHAVLDDLPEEYQELIMLRYLKRGKFGSRYSDDYVYDSLGLSRATYYRLKPKVLEALGRALHAKQNNHK